MKTKHWVMAIIMLIVLIILGGLREIIFVNINEQIEFNAGRIDSYRVLETFSFLKELSSDSLVNLKWGLTIAYTCLFLVLSIISLKYILLDKEGVKWLLIGYAGAFILAGAIYVLGKLFEEPQLGYTLSRVVMGALQSPFPLMLMIPARMLARS